MKARVPIFAGLAAMASLTLLAEDPPAIKPSSDSPETIVDCDGPAELVSHDRIDPNGVPISETTTNLHNNVVATGNNLKLTCDNLVVVAVRHGNPGGMVGQRNALRSLVATGHVHILQFNREAVCGRAEIFPGEDRIVLTEDPVINSTDGSGYTASGDRMVLYRGQKRAVIEAVKGHRAHIELPTIPDLGFENPTGGPASPASPPAAPSQPPPK